MNLFEQQSNEFIPRHIGTIGQEKEMLQTIGVKSIEELIDKTIPASIRTKNNLNIPDAVSEAELLKQLKEISLRNKTFKTYIGQGYYDTITPSVILRNIFENPGWYTQYTPYQAEISQGRLESLLNFQSLLNEKGYNTLAINLSLGLDNRHEMYDCQVPHRHRYSDAADEIGQRRVEQQVIERLPVRGAD